MVRSIRVPLYYKTTVKNRVNISYFNYSGRQKSNREGKIDFLTQTDIADRYGTPDWIGRKQTMLGLKTQWFYQLGAGKIRYVFFVDDQLIWDWIITEQKMLEVVYPDNELC